MRLPAFLLAALLLAGCLSDQAAPTPPTSPADAQTDHASLKPVEASFQGSVSGTPVAPGESRHEVQVPQGAVGVNGTLTWSTPGVRLALELIDPNGEVAERGRAEADGRVVVATTSERPPSGGWTFRVVSSAPVPVEYRLQTVVELIVPQDNVVAKTVQLATGGFYEVNVIMEAGASFAFAFNATQPVKWDVHSHPNGQYKQWHKGEGVTAAGSFSAETRGIYSLLFERPGAPAEPASNVTFEMRGAFRMHSHAQ